MADYHPLIARAVEGLENSTGEARRSLYERARAALVSQLRSMEPALSEADITRERLALEDAIRKVEAESVRKTRSERPAPPRAAPPRTPFQPAAPSTPRRDRPGQPPSAMPTATPGAMPSASRPEFGSPASPRLILLPIVLALAAIVAIAGSLLPLRRAAHFEPALILRGG